MRKSAFLVAVAVALLAGCVTVNVYFPAAAAKKAADQVIGNIMGPESSAPAEGSSSGTPPTSSPGTQPGQAATPTMQPEPVAMRVLDAIIPAARAATPGADLHVKTPAIEAIEARMRARFHSTLKALLESGAVGFTHNGNVAIHDASKVPLSQRLQLAQTVAAENADRAELYKQLAIANGHSDWAERMRESFAQRWIAMARPGWYYQDASGKWQRKGSR